MMNYSQLNGKIKFMFQTFPNHQSDEKAIGLSTDHWDLSMDFWGIPKKNPTIRPSVPSVAGTGFRTAGKPTSRERSESHQLWGVD